MFPVWHENRSHITSLLCERSKAKCCQRIAENYECLKLKRILILNETRIDPRSSPINSFLFEKNHFNTAYQSMVIRLQSYDLLLVVYVTHTHTQIYTRT